MMANQKPVAEVRIGRVKATIWPVVSQFESKSPIISSSDQTWSDT